MPLKQYQNKKLSTMQIYYVTTDHWVYHIIYVIPYFFTSNLSDWNLELIWIIAVGKLKSTLDIINCQQCLYTSLACKNSSSVENEFFDKIDLTSFLNRLKLFNFLIFKGKRLYNLTPICNTLFWSKDILWDCVWRSYLLLVLFILILTNLMH